MLEKKVPASGCGDCALVLAEPHPSPAISRSQTRTDDTITDSGAVDIDGQSTDLRSPPKPTGIAVCGLWGGGAGGTSTTNRPPPLVV